GDTDLLVPPASSGTAGEVLGRLGFRPIMRESEVPAHWGGTMHAFPWERPGEAGLVDLHVNLPGVAVPAERTWTILSETSEPMQIGNAEAHVLREPARAL